MKLIHYSPELIEALDDRKYDQNNMPFHHKPNGLWISVHGSCDWKNWCENENFSLENLRYSYEISVKKNANILYISTPEELYEFTKKYPFSTRQFDMDYDTYQIDWYKVKSKYQGIIIAPYQWDCRLSLESNWYYSWDCASGCLWDLKCIDKFERVLDSVAKVLNDNKTAIST